MLTSSTIAYWFNGSNTVSLENLAAGQHPVILYADPYGSSFCCDDYGTFIFDTLVLNQPEQLHYSIPFEENFEDGMPCDWDNSSNWTFGESSDVEGPYWQIPEHNQFAVSNDDACDCDMMQDKLITPPLIIDDPDGDIILSFSAYYTSDYGSIANIEISNDMGYSWQNILTLPSSYQWQDISINISDYISSETIQIAFRPTRKIVMLGVVDLLLMM